MASIVKLELLDGTGYDILMRYLKSGVDKVLLMSGEEVMDLICSMGSGVISFGSGTKMKAPGKEMVEFGVKLHRTHPKELIDALKIECIYELMKIGSDYDDILEMKYKYNGKYNVSAEEHNECSVLREDVIRWKNRMEYKIQDLRSQLPHGELPNNSIYKFVIDYEEDGSVEMKSKRV